ncbi:MAG: hypothetical protein JNN08_16900 [Bryobacterales bacterium]|nr:hypothetical protein [Bryobacterales bacterium]
MTSPALFCRNCGKALSEEEKALPGTILCGVCLPAASAATVTAPPVYTSAARADSGVSPGLAFLLGLIPGVGAIYNAQYVKGLIHVFIFGLLLSLVSMSGHGGDSLEPLLGLMLAVWVPYMAFEAYHTARKRQLGLQVDEFSSVLPLRHGNLAGPAALIGIGIIFLLNNLDLLRISQVLRYWPVGLIGLGLYMLYVRLTSSPSVPAAPEVSHEHNQ